MTQTAVATPFTRNFIISFQPAAPPEDATELPAGVGRDNYHETRHFLDFLAGAAPESDLADAIISVRLGEAIAEGYRGPLSDFRAARR